MSDSFWAQVAVVEHTALPPMWDGARVEWTQMDRFAAAFEMFVCPPPKKPERCSNCKSTRGPVTWKGLRHPIDGELFETTVTKMGRWGRPVEVPRQVPAWPVYDLCAFRCVDCLHDEVWDMRTGEWWDLGPEDYGPEGSISPVDAEAK